MTDREAFEACPDLQDYCDFSRCPDGTRRGIVVYNDPWTQGAWQGWQAALASERAKQSAATNVGIDWANPATLNGVLCHALQAEPVPFNAPGKVHVEAMLGSASPPAVQGEPVAFVITDEKINFLQVNSIKRFIERAKHAHFTNIYYRINGKDEVVEADWLKHLQLASPPAVQAKTQGYTISRDEEWNLVVTEGTYEDDEAVRLLRRAKRNHRYFDTVGDVTSCPAADELGPCDCGADAFNAEIDDYLAKVEC